MSVRTSILFATVLLATVVAGAQGAAEAVPKMVVPETTVDVGKVAQGDVVDGDFKFVNEGAAPLKIEAVRPSCGCTVADYDKEIAPGATGNIRIHLDTRDYSGPTSKSVLVMTNNPDPASVTLIIKADVRPYVEVLPKPLVRINTLQKEQGEQKLVIVALEEKPDFKITEVSKKSEFLTVSTRQLSGDDLVKDKPTPQYEVTVKVAENAPVGPLQDELTIATNHPKAAKIPVKVYGIVRAVLQVSPPSVQFGQAKASTNPGRTLIVVNNRPSSPVQITGAKIDDDGFTASVAEEEQGKRFKVTITVKPDAKPGPRDLTLKLTTTDPEFPELLVPVRASLT